MSPQKEKIKISTTSGIFEVELWPHIAPKACENFKKHAESGYYDGIIFHRVIPNFMIQGGDPTGTGTGGESIWNRPFDDECDKSVTFSEPGLLAMANAGPGTNGSQFFITTVETPWLHMKHTIFGKVTEGYEVVQSIENVERDSSDRPKREIKIVKMRLLSPSEAS